MNYFNIWQNPVRFFNILVYMIQMAKILSNCGALKCTECTKTYVYNSGVNEPMIIRILLNLIGFNHNSMNWS